MKRIIILIGFIYFETIKLIAQPGTLDNTFDKDGIVTTHFGEDAFASGMIIQPNGKIVVTGYSKSKFILTCYKSNGQLDSSFGNKGTVESSLSQWIKPNAIALQSDGKIIVCGHYGGGYSALARYDSSGVLDRSFGIDGLIQYKENWNDGSELVNLLIEPNGNILVTGTYVIIASDGHYTGFLVRFNKNATQVLNSTYFGLDYEFLNPNISISLQNDGKILVAGVYDHLIGTFVLRLTTDFQTDSTFNKSGKVIIKDKLYRSSLGLQKDGKIILSGGSAVYRLNDNGEIDGTFGNNGKVNTLMTNYNQPPSVQVQRDGKIIVAGEASNKGCLIRYLVDGRIDSTFGIQGITYTTIGNTYQITSLFLQLDGKIVVAGYSFNGNDSDFALSRYNPGLILKTKIPSVFQRSIKIYPNPIIKESTLDLYIEKEEVISIYLVDCQGKLIKSFFANDKFHQGFFKLPLVFPDGLNSGSYYLIVSTPTEQRVSKILKE